MDLKVKKERRRVCNCGHDASSHSMRYRYDSTVKQGRYSRGVCGYCEGCKEFKENEFLTLVKTSIIEEKLRLKKLKKRMNKENGKC